MSRLKLEEIPFEFEGKTYQLRCNMAVLEEVQEFYDGDLGKAMRADGSTKSAFVFLSAMLNDYADEQGWPERFTWKQIARQFTMGSAKASGILADIFRLVTRSIAPPEEENQNPDAQPAENVGN